MRARVWVNGLLVAALLAVSSGAAAHAARRAVDGGPAVAVAADGVTLEWHTPPVTISGGDTPRVDVPGYARTSAPGQPDLPVSSVLIALPPGAAPSLSVEAVTESQQALSGALALVPQADGVQVDAHGVVAGGAFAPAAALDFDPGVVALTPAGTARGVALARLSFYPARPAKGGLVVTEHVRVRVNFNAPAAGSAAAGPLDPYLLSLQSQVVNPEHLAAPAGSGSLVATPGPGPGSLAVEVTQPGLTELTYAALLAAGFPVDSANPHHLVLVRDGVESALEWDGDGDLSFEPGERLLFYADPRFSRWTAADVYWLWASGGSGLRMGTRPGSPVGLPAGRPWVERLIEQNKVYTPECYCGLTPPGRDGDRWAWEALHQPGHASATFTGTLSGVDTSVAGALTVWVIGSTDRVADPDHHVDVGFNSLPIGSLEWNGRQAITGTWTLPAVSLVNGLNALDLSLPGLPGASPESMWLDAYKVRYALSSTATGPAVTFQGESVARAYTVGLTDGAAVRAYDITDPAAPLRLTGIGVVGGQVTLGDYGAGGRAYAVTSASGVRAPARLRAFVPLQTAGLSAVDYVVVSHPAFIPALGALTVLRESQGLAVGVENLHAIYDSYGGGRPLPDAIRAYLADAYGAWSPTYVLLVGDGTADPRRYAPGTPETFLPPYLAEVDPWAGETASDNRYVTVDGDDKLPDMLIGRLPVNSLAEAHTVTGKIFSYETRAVDGPWRSLVSLVADDPDSAGDFPAQAEQAAGLIGSPRTVERLYYDPGATTAAAVRAAVLDRFDQGAALILFAGHSSIHQWAVENFLHLTDAAGFDNGLRLPVVLQMTCFSGMFQAPGLSGLDETLLRQPGGGAVAVWGATGLGLATGHEALADGFLSHYVANDPAALGAAVLAGKLHLAAVQPGYDDLLDTFTLLGDPATQLSLAANPWKWQSTWLPAFIR